jgi:hypothetical protein
LARQLEKSGRENLAGRGHFPLGLAQIHSRDGKGVEAPQVTVEVHLSGGLSRTHIAGTI